MNLTKMRMFIVVMTASVTSVFAGTRAIGVASAVGTFSIDSNTVSGNANVVNGSDLKTADAASQVLLNNGSTLALASHSSGTVFSDRFVLKSGAARIDNLEKYGVSASDLTISSGQPKSKASVSLTGNTIQIASLAGSIQVFDAKGALLTRVAAGTSATFKTKDPQTGASGAGGASGTTTTTVLIATGATIAAVAGAVAIAKVVDNNQTPTSP